MIRPTLCANLEGTEDPVVVASYVAYLEAAFRDDHSAWLSKTYKKHGPSSRFAAKCVRRFYRWLIAMRAYAVGRHGHFVIDYLSVSLHFVGHDRVRCVAYVEVNQRAGISYPEGKICSFCE